MTREREFHLRDERIQALLDGEISGEDRARVDAHVAGCSRCRRKVEAWKSLFAGLESLPRLDPPPGFPERVLEHVPRRETIWSRLAARLGWGKAGRRRRAHPPTERILDYLDGVLGGPARDGLETHLGACVRCRGELHRWEGVFARLAKLSHMEPAPGFADRVLARARAAKEAGAPGIPGVEASPSPGERLGGWLERLLPHSAPGWAVACAAVLVPALTLVGGSFALFSHPRLTPAYLMAFLSWRATGAAGELVGRLWEQVVTSPILQWALSATGELSAPLEALGLTALLFSAGTAGSLWILYRNLALPSETDAHASSSRP